MSQSSGNDAPFEIIRELGRGGMGVVYLARERASGQMAALKVLAPRVAKEPAFVKRFLREARTAAQLSHPNIVHCHGLGRQRGAYYLVLEFVEGKTLDEILREKKKLEPREALQIVRQVALALAEAHRLGIVHRDIKPHNLIVDGEGRVRVMDFGLAKGIGAESDLTQTGERLGTPLYMAPEQCTGHDVDGRADLYALGVTLFELLTGASPWDKTLPAVAMLYIVVHSPFPPLVLTDRGVPSSLPELVSRLVAKDPNERYPTAEALISDIDACLEGRPLASVAEVHAKAASRVAAPPVANAAASVEPEQSTWISIVRPLGRPTHPSGARDARILRWSRRRVAVGVCVALMALTTTAWLAYRTQLRVFEFPEDRRVGSLLRAENWPDSEFYRFRLRQAGLVDAQGFVTVPKNLQFGLRLAPNEVSDLSFLDKINDPDFVVLAITPERFERSLARLQEWRIASGSNSAIERLDHAPIARQASLRALFLFGCEVSPRMMEAFGEMPNLMQLEIGYTALDPQVYDRLPSLRSLRLLGLTSSDISDEDLIEVGKMTWLFELDLCYNDVGDEGVSHLGDLVNLRFLCLESTHVSDVGLKEIIPRMTYLSELSIGGLQVSDEGLEFITRLPRLEVFRGKGIRLHDSIALQFANMKSLKLLIFDATELSDAALQVLRQQLPGCEIQAFRNGTRI